MASSTYDPLPQVSVRIQRCLRRLLAVSSPAGVDILDGWFIPKAAVATTYNFEALTNRGFFWRMAGPIEKSIVAIFRFAVLMVGITLIGMAVYGLLEFDKREAYMGNPLWLLALLIGIVCVRLARPMSLYWWGKD